MPGPVQAIVFIAVEIRNPKGFGRVRMESVPDVSKDRFVSGAVEPGTTVHTDGWPAYLSLSERGYEHERTVMSAQSDPAHVVMPGRAPDRELAQALAAGNPPGSGQPRAPRRLLLDFDSC